MYSSHLLSEVMVKQQWRINIEGGTGHTFVGMDTMCVDAHVCYCPCVYCPCVGSNALVCVDILCVLSYVMMLICEMLLCINVLVGC